MLFNHSMQYNILYHNTICYIIGGDVPEEPCAAGDGEGGAQRSPAHAREPLLRSLPRDPAQ